MDKISIQIIDSQECSSSRVPGMVMSATISAMGPPVEPQRQKIIRNTILDDGQPYSGTYTTDAFRAGGELRGVHVINAVSVYASVLKRCVVTIERMSDR